MKWIMTSKEFLREAVQNKTGKNKGMRSLWFNGKRKDKVTGDAVEYCKPQFEKYIAHDFQRLMAKR